MGALSEVPRPSGRWGLKMRGAVLLAVLCAALMGTEAIQSGNRSEENGQSRHLLQRPQAPALIVGGQSAPCGRFPYMVSLRSRDNRHVCSGILVHKRWVLTVAHCVDPNQVNTLSASPVIVIGACNLNDEMNENGVVELSVAKRTIIHEKWSGEVADGYDIALLKLQDKSKFAPVNLPTASHMLQGDTNLVVLGWGGGSESQLQLADRLETVSNNVCGMDDVWGDIIVDSMLCVFSPAGQDVCSGDSGSPALEAFAPSNSISAGRPALDIAVGITSFGGSVSCPDNMLPSVFTRLSSYRQWIDGVIQGSSSAVAESDSISPPTSEPPTPSSPPSTAEVPSAASFAAEPDSIPPLRFEPPTASSPPSTAEVPFALTPVPAQSSAAPPSPQPNPQNILWEAARDGDEEMAKMALEAGADAEFEYSLFGNSSEVVATPLYVASRNGHVNVVKVLLAAKANPDHGTNKRSTPLMAAAEHGHFLVVQALIKAGADPKKKRANGDTALHFAAAQLGNSSERIVDALLDAGAVLDARGGDGQTPLMWAAYFGNLGMVEQLIKEGADSSIKDDHGATALESVCGCQFFEGSTGDIACPKGGCDLPSTAEEIRSLLS